MASLRHLQPDPPSNSSSTSGALAPNDDVLALAEEQQQELGARANAEPGNDPSQLFDSSMTRDEVRARFMKLVKLSRKGVFA